ncbi:glycosyltransferase [Rhodococcus gannanensis]|uniref:Glycosyltransferase n=1 Tax=Rhodococcus gannanensis TaxID=1960308 RepID=A0ABW4P977_9NOCA
MSVPWRTTTRPALNVGRATPESVPASSLRRRDESSFRPTGDSPPTARGRDEPADSPGRRPQQLPRLVSVIIPVRNGLPHIDEQLRALADQDYAGDWEVIVSDNGSTDGTREHLESHAVTSTLDLTLVDSSARTGVSHARNVGACAARGDLFVFFDADDRVRPDCLTNLVDAAQGFDAVSGALVTTEINSVAVAKSRRIFPPDKPWEMAAGIPTLPGANHAVWRHAHNGTGGWDESLTASEDNDFAWRLQRSGYTIGHSADAIVDYRLRSPCRQVWNQGMAYGEGEVDIRVKHVGDELFPAFPNPLRFPLTLVGFIAKNPLLPMLVTRTPRRYWLFSLGYEVGRIRGSIRHRVLCI